MTAKIERANLHELYADHAAGAERARMS